jgi:hypothetical protein
MSDIAYIIPIKINDEDKESNIYRLNNLNYILNIPLIDKLNITTYIIESGLSKNKNITNLINNIQNKKIKHFLVKRKNNMIDRAHLFNCAIKHFIKDERIIIMGDCDIPILNNIIDCIRDIKETKYNFISPYDYIIKLNNDQSSSIIGNKNDLNLINLKNFTFTNNLYTFSGGILIVNREIFENIGLWFEFDDYGCEDTVLDVILYKLKKNEIKRYSNIYFHLWHPTYNYDNIRFMKKVHFIKKIFGCSYNPNAKTRHETCKHFEKDKWIDLYKTQKKGDLNKYNKN